MEQIMNKEFKKINKKSETRYVLETMTSGGTGAGSIATAEKPLGELQKRQSITVPTQQKPRQGPLRPQTGAGKHKDKKKDAKQGKEKHRKPFAEGFMEPDHEISMASNELQSIASDAKKLLILVKRYSEMEGLEAWQQSKITKAADYMTSVLRSIGGDQRALESQVNEYETHTYKDSQGNVWRVNDEGDKELVSAAPGSSGGGSRYGSRYPRRTYTKPSGMYFYNVKPGQENDAKAAGLMQSKSGKWYSTFQNSWAEKTFGPGKYWQPKNENVAESGNNDLRDTVMNVLQTIHNGASSGDDMIDYLADELNDYYKHVRKSGDKTLQKAYSFMMDQGQEAEDDPELMAQIAGQAINMLKQGVEEGDDPLQNRADYARQHGQGQVYKKTYPGDKVGMTKTYAYDVKRTGPKGQLPKEGLRDPKDNPCWKGYHPVGTKKKGGRTVPNCVPNANEDVYIGDLMSQLYEKAPPGDKYERMVKHIKKGYAKDGKVTDQEKSIAYATAWKAKNKAKK